MAALTNIYSLGRATGLLSLYSRHPEEQQLFRGVQVSLAVSKKSLFRGAAWKNLVGVSGKSDHWARPDLLC